MKNISKKGFTLVELSLAITFISVLLLTIGFLTIHITSIYQKGLAMKAVNATAKELIDDISRSISSAPIHSADSLCLEKYAGGANPSAAYLDCVKDNARKLVYQQRYGSVSIKNSKDATHVPTNGVFCTGRYSYIWNTAYVLNSDDYQNKGDYVHFRGSLNGDNNYRLKKVTDFGRKLCLDHMEPDRYFYDNSAEYNIANPTAIELLDNSENDLALYDFTIFKPSIHWLTNSAFYSGTFVLATIRGGIDINSVGNYCSDPPDNLNTDFAYCAVNKFNFSMQAAGNNKER